MKETELKTYLASITPADPTAIAGAIQRQAQLAKPPGSLGRLEDISVKLAGITGKVQNSIENCRILVFAADNGIIQEGVASTPESVTYSQAINMTMHKTGMSALAQAFGNSVVVADMGIHNEKKFPELRDFRVRPGTRNFAKEPALTRSEVLKAMEAGLTLVEEAKAEGVEAIGVGEMGIGNTSTSSAVLAGLTGASAAEVTGRGSGLTDEAFAVKKQVIAHALALHKPDAKDPLDVLSKVGGLDLSAMTGAFLACAKHRIPAVVDGFISIVAALCAVRLCPAVRDFLFLSHVSYEIGYRIAQKELGLDAYLMLDMRLGEGSGCPLAFEILKAACAIISHMATFQEAAINDDYLENLRTDAAFEV